MQATHTNSIDMQAMGKRAKDAAVTLAELTTEQKNAALIAIADLLETETPAILAANALDLQAAREKGVDPIWMRDRMAMDKRMVGMIADVRKVAELPDPVGESYDQRTLQEGLHIERRRVPLGVLGTIYESRPNVTVDIATLGLKTGNAVILRGGSDVLNTNTELVRILQDALRTRGIPQDAVQFIDSADRAYVGQMLKLHQYIDMIIPRGGPKLHDFCRENSTIPVIIGGMGVCHIFVDASADLDKSLPVIHNAKTQKPAVCNAVETLLVHESIAEAFLPRVVTELAAAGVIFKADERSQALLAGHEGVDAATDEDYHTEWTALVLNLRVVPDLETALAHIREHGTQHSDSILTQDPHNAERFLNVVDSAAVYWNASTRWTDGSAFGLGAEVAVSTQKLHARGPMALQELTTYKWIVRGDYTPRP
jgi:glutamate-5-semialdehyde dehydrogenase